MSAVLKNDEGQPVILKAGEKQDVGYAIPLWLRDIQIKHALSRIKGRIEPVDEPRTDPVALVCFGPSLADTWEQIRDFKTIITCSGAHKFLKERGIIPTYHMEVDPRAHKVQLIGTPSKETEYWISSTCHKAVFDHLEGYNVRLWHVFDGHGDSGRFIPHGEDALVGGCGVGLRLFQAAAYKGFRDCHVFGMDGCERDGKKHASYHPNEPKKHALVEYPEGSGTFYQTTASMLEAARATVHEVAQLPKLKFTFYGEGLVQAMMKQETPAPEAKVSNIVALKKPVLISDKLREMNAQLHNDNALYGAGGHRHAELVKKLVADTKAESVLDYGCGKGTLAENLPFPIWQYDPAIPGKDEMPRSADLVLCLDVLEHIEPDLLGNVLGHLAKLVKKVGYFVISTRPAKKTYSDGRNAHLIVKSGEWWEKTLSKFFSLGSITEKDKELHVVVGPKGAKNASLSNTNVRHDGTDATFYTPNETTRWRANTLFTKEPCTIAWIDTFKKGEVFYDIGANVGGYSIWAAKRRGVKVYAFEPEASNYAVLCRNMTLNEVDGAAYCAALSDQTRLSSIYLSTQEAGGSCNSFNSQVGFDLKPRQGIKQGAIGFSLDDVCGYEKEIGSLPDPDHIKIDVDGMEHLVIKGGLWLFGGRSVKSLLIECNPNLPEHVEMMASLESLGFQYDRQQFEAAQRKEGAFKGCGECIFTRSNPVRDRLIEKIRAAEIREYPFEHIYIEDVFPQEVFEKISKEVQGYSGGEGYRGSAIAYPTTTITEYYEGSYNVYNPTPDIIVGESSAYSPPLDEFQPLEKSRGTKGYPQRYVADAPSFLNWMTDGALRKALDEKFRMLSGNDEICLLRDKPGYAIGPHTDTPAKAVTALFYLTQNWTEAEHGTTAYKPKKLLYSDPEGRHGKFEDFDEVWTAPGKPNSVFIFKRTNTSFHGCKPYEGTGQRDILLWDSKQYLDK